MKVVVLGGTGEAGRRVAELLLARTPATVVVTGRDAARARAVAEELEGWHQGRAEGRAVDLHDPASLREVLGGAAAVVEATSVLDAAATVAEAVCDAHCALVDLHFDPAVTRAYEAHAARFAEAGVSALVQAGFHPGLPATLVRLAALELDTVSEAIVGSVLRPKGGVKHTQSVSELVGQFPSYKARVFRDGQWRTVTGARRSDWERFGFELGMGTWSCVPMDLEELLSLPDEHPSLRRVGFYIAGFNGVTNAVVFPMVAGILAVAPHKGLDPAGRLFTWSTRAFARPPFGTALQLQAAGTKDGRPARLRLTLKHDDEYDMTAAPVVALLEQVLDGSVHAPGLHYAARVPEPRRTLASLEAMGVSTARSLSVDAPN